MKKILVICNLQKDILEEYNSKIKYIPNLSDCCQSDWEHAIKSVMPKIVLYGTGYFTKDMIATWRNYLPNEKLYIVRKGVSLSRCDLDAAKNYSITVLNTPGINSIFVANYMSQFLFKENKKFDRVAIIGVGKIGKNVAIEAEKNKVDTILYSKTLKNNFDLDIIKSENKIKNSHSQIAKNLEEAFSTSNKIAISLPLDKDTNAIINANHIDLIRKGSVLVSASSPHIFTDEALRTLYDRNDIFVVIDHLKSELEETYKIIWHTDLLRENFIMDEKAAASPECQQAMSLAAIKKCIDLENS